MLYKLRDHTLVRTTLPKVPAGRLKSRRSWKQAAWGFLSSRLKIKRLLGFFSRRALSRGTSNDPKSVPYCSGGMEATDVKGPLVQFQAAQFSKDEMRRVVKMVNGELADAALPPDVLDSVFEMWWSKLNDEVTQTLAIEDGSGGEVQRSERELLEEVLGLTRRIASDRERRLEPNHPAWEDLMMGLLNLVRVTRARTSDDEATTAIRRIIGPLEFIARREGRNRGSNFRHILMELEDLLASDLSTKAAAAGSEESTG